LDELKLPVADDDHSILFFDSNVLLVGQTEGTLLAYDLRAGSEAVIRERPFPEFPITAIARLQDGRVVISDTIGSLTVLDLRMGEKALKGKRGFVGCPAGTVQIGAHPRLPMFGVLSLDRMLRLYDVEKAGKVAVKGGFVRTRGECFALLDDDVPVEPEVSDEEWERLPEDGAGIWDDFRPGVRGVREESD
jgi:hypothetical protein